MGYDLGFRFARPSLARLAQWPAAVRDARMVRRVIFAPLPGERSVRVSIGKQVCESTRPRQYEDSSRAFPADQTSGMREKER
ncbi:MAG TPA: hypothetical protein VE801_17310, partial [Xanthobacteraceae bacterium]|nr:hypothetical protein [Xanthobacteraceae bacterium]